MLILAFLLGFHTITFKCNSFTKIAFFKSSCCGKKPGGIAVVSENVVTDRHTYKTSTVTLAVHEYRGLVSVSFHSFICMARYSLE